MILSATPAWSILEPAIIFIKISVVPYSGKTIWYNTVYYEGKLFVDVIVKTFHRYRFEDYN